MSEGNDRRDVSNWVVLTLTRLGEVRAEEGNLPRLLREALSLSDNYPVYIPLVTYVKQGQRVTVHLMEGYAFVAAGPEDTRFYELEGDNPYVQKVLSTKVGSVRILSVIPDKTIREMESKLREHVVSDITVGMTITITEGPLAPLQGEVLDIVDQTAALSIRLRSLDIITNLPLTALEPAEEEP